MMRTLSTTAGLFLTASLLAQTTLFLQPDAAEGKDALVHGLPTEQDNNWDMSQLTADAGPSTVYRV